VEEGVVLGLQVLVGLGEGLELVLAVGQDALQLAALAGFVC
jgi:hypothetical protein